MNLARRNWERCIVAAPGPSLTHAVANMAALRQQQGWKILAINDAWRRLPFADAMYTSDGAWWDVHGDIDFAGERWASQAVNPDTDDDKVKWGRVDELRLNLVPALRGDTFSTRGPIHYGENSGFAGVNLAIQFGAVDVKLIGFDMQRTNGQEHFFGDHPEPLHNGSDFPCFIRAFTNAAKSMPAGVSITNCTTSTALCCFPVGDL
jgi:hypothetical protein